MKRQIVVVLVTILAALCAIVLLLAGCDKEQPLGFGAQRLAVAEHTFHSAIVTNTNGTAMDVSMFPKIGVQVEGIVDATVTFEATIDNDTWYAVEAVNRNNGAKATSTTADGIFSLSVAEFKLLRCPISSWVSGTITVRAIGLDNGIADPADMQVSDITGTVDIGEVSGIVSVDATGQGDVPISTSRDLTVTLDSEVVSVDITNSDDITVTLNGETVALGTGASAIGTVTVTSVTTGTVNVGQISNALPAGTNNIGDVGVASVAAGETHVGEIGTPSEVISITVAVSNTVYASGDLLFDTATLTDVLRVNGGTGVIYQIQVFDPDDQGQPMEFYILDTSCTWGTWNATPSVTDACVMNVICGPISVLSSDFADVNNSRVAKVSPACLVEAGTGSNDLYIVGISRGTGTYADGYLGVRVAVMQD